MQSPTSTSTTASLPSMNAPLAPWEQTLRELQNSWAATYLDSRPVTTATLVPATPRPAGC